MIVSNQEFFKHLETRFTWAPFLKLTYLCDNECEHCCERAGPNCEPKFIELVDIKNILEQFKYIKNFSKYVTLTGGEPMMAYVAKNEHYIPTILKYCGKNGYDVSINTNAHWTSWDCAGKIYSDFDEFVKKYNNRLTFHLSLDKWHRNPVESNAKFLNWIVKNNTISADRTNLYMFFDGPEIVIQLIMKLKTDFDLELLPEPVLQTKFFSLHKFSGTDKTLCIMPYFGIDNLGRARDNGLATKELFSKTDIYFSNRSDPDKEICFDANGIATLCACDDDTIKTPYYEKNGKMKNLAVIKRELFDMAYKAYSQENQF